MSARSSALVEMKTGPPPTFRRALRLIVFLIGEKGARHPCSTADWAANLRAEQSGAYSFEMMTSGPTILFVDNQKVIETSAVEESLRRSTVILSQGDHRVMIRYFKKGYFSTIWLVWQPPSGERSVVSLRPVRPLSREEYIRLRDRLPFPQAR